MPANLMILVITWASPWRPHEGKSVVVQGLNSKTDKMRRETHEEQTSLAWWECAGFELWLSILYEVCGGDIGSSSFLSLPSNPEHQLLLKLALWWVCELRRMHISVLWTDCWHRGTGQSLLPLNFWFPGCSLNLRETQPRIAPWPCLFDQEAVYSEGKSGTLTLCPASVGTSKQQCVPFQGYTSLLLSVSSFWSDVLESE